MIDYIAKQPCTLADGARLAEGQRIRLTSAAARYPLALGWIGPAEPPPPEASAKKAASKPARKRRTPPKKKTAPAPRGGD